MYAYMSYQMLIIRFDSSNTPVTTIRVGLWFDMDQTSPPQTFDTFSNAFATVFQIVTVDNWDLVMSSLYLVSGGKGISTMVLPY